jgi:hypothetical protein
MRPVDTYTPAVQSREELLRRNEIFETFFKAEAPRLAEACHEISRRFLAAFGLRKRCRHRHPAYINGLVLRLLLLV